MSTEVKNEEVKAAKTGLTIRTFDGEAKEKLADGSEKKFQYKYDRIVLPWSRTGKDTDGKEVDGSIPKLSELVHWAQQSGFTVEIETKEGSPIGPSVVQFAIEGINAHLNRTAAKEAQNTEESALEAVLQMFMKKRGCTREKAIEILTGKLG